MVSNKKKGNAFEIEVSKMLKEEGCWVHRLNANSSGQPADIIAVKNGRAILIDAKDCANNKFDMKRIEENQYLAMTMWKKKGNGTGWFAMNISKGVYFVSSEILFTLSEHMSSLTEKEIMEVGITCKELINLYEIHI